MYIAHDIFLMIKKDQSERVQRKQELSKLKHELMTLKQQNKILSSLEGTDE